MRALHASRAGRGLARQLCADPRSAACVTGLVCDAESGPEVRRLPARPAGRRRAAAAHVLHSLVQLRQRPRLRAQLALVGTVDDADARATALLRPRALPQPGPDPAFRPRAPRLQLPQLFTENRFVGGDRFGDANQLTLAA